MRYPFQQKTKIGGKKLFVNFWQCDSTLLITATVHLWRGPEDSGQFSPQIAEYVLRPTSWTKSHHSRVYHYDWDSPDQVWQINAINYRYLPSKWQMETYPFLSMAVQEAMARALPKTQPFFQGYMRPSSKVS